MPSRVPQCRLSHAVLVGERGMLIPQAARNAAQVYFSLQRKRPQSMAEERPLQPCMHYCKTASHLLDLIQGVVVCADACIVDCGEPHNHWVSDAALHASHTLVRANAVQVPNTSMGTKCHAAHAQGPSTSGKCCSAQRRYGDNAGLLEAQAYDEHAHGISAMCTSRGSRHQRKDVMM